MPTLGLRACDGGDESLGLSEVKAHQSQCCHFFPSCALPCDNTQVREESFLASLRSETHTS
eukprot:m.63263 g.63263  ORF g.63263 m.63263 type:complete len:61 (+) comp11944_c1_seq1:4449-4631(+)